MITPRLVTAPVGLPVSVADLKAHLAITFDDDDAKLEAYISAAVAYLDGWRGVLGRCIMTQTWAFDDEAFPCLIPLPDVQSVALAYTDTNGAAQTFEGFTVRNTSRGAELVYTDSKPSIQSGSLVTATVTAGYDVVPDGLKLAIKFMAARAYDNPQGTITDAVKLDMFDKFTAPHRWANV